MFFLGGCYNFHVLVRFLFKQNKHHFRNPYLVQILGFQVIHRGPRWFRFVDCNTLRETNSEFTPENKTLEKEILIANHHFLWAMLLQLLHPKILHRTWIHDSLVQMIFLFRRAPILRWTMLNFRGCKSWFTAFSWRSLSLELIGKNPFFLWNLQTPHTNGKKLASGKYVFLSYLGLLPFQVHTIHHGHLHVLVSGSLETFICH